MPILNRQQHEAHIATLPAREATLRANQIDLLTARLERHYDQLPSELSSALYFCRSVVSRANSSREERESAYRRLNGAMSHVLRSET